MSDYLPPIRDMRFVLHDLFHATAEFARLYPELELDEALSDAILEEAGKFCQEVLAPLNRDGDEVGCRLDDGHVTTPPGFREAYKTYVEAGWPGFSGPVEYGGQGMPKALHVLVEEMIYGANTAFCLYPSLTSGAIHALSLHGSKDLVDIYLQKLVSGEWSGTMCLTEPHAGSDLGLIRTRATPDGDAYRISGTKIFITGGEHDLTDNIIHLVLARLPDAPAGVKGISLFLVPKWLPDADGQPGERNSVVCSAIEHKMGIKGSSTCVMNFDDAKGFLIGEPNEGLKYMFSMMNNERISIGIQGIGLAYRSFLTARSYAQERLQSRAPLAQDKPPHAIVEHPDVRRMLLHMRCFVESARMSAVMLGLKVDEQLHGQDEQKRREAGDWVAFLTPVAKAFWTDLGFEATNHGVQVLGGHGYIREWGQEQHVRDARIAQIYEGTNGIQAMDLVGRKLLADQGRKFGLFADWLEEQANDGPDWAREPAKELLSQLRSVTDWLLSESQGRPALAGAVATDYLHLTGLAWFAGLWLSVLRALPDAQCLAEEDKRTKELLARFFFDKMAIRAVALARSIRTGEESLMAFDGASI
jgi:hypothetical protein